MAKRIKIVRVAWSPTKRRPLMTDLIKPKGKILAFLQARRTSTRFPDKIYADINGAPLLYHALARAREARLVDDVIVVSPHELPDVPDGVEVFVWHGDENDVLGRYAAAARHYRPDFIVRLTSDCPLLDPNLIDFVVHYSAEMDYTSNVLTASFPDGVDVEVISWPGLIYLDNTVTDPMDREHVTRSVRNTATRPASFALCGIECKTNYSGTKISVDTMEDLERVRKIERRLS